MRAYTLTHTQSPVHPLSPRRIGLLWFPRGGQAMSEAQALQHILEHHAGADGWITLSRKEANGYHQHHYRLSELPDILREWIGEDVYFSQNTFYRPSRRVENIRQLRALYVDVDSYLLNLVSEWVVQSMQLGLFRERVPEPNLIIHSGRGLGLVWFLEPVPVQALPLWQAVENYLVKECQAFGSDARASDAARILRLAGTVNSKNHQIVHVEYRHNTRYTLRDIEQEYLPNLRPKRSSPRHSEPQRPSVDHRMYKVYTLHYARLSDLVKLCELREWNVTGYREVILFLYRYWSCCFLADAVEALENTLDINTQFTAPLGEPEVITATRSAEKAWRARSNPEANRIAKEQGYPGAGYNVSNDKLIEWLNITDEEQRQLDTIISRRVKYDRWNSKRQKARRKSGMQSRDKYLSQAEERRREAIRLRSEGLTQKQIAAHLGITQQAVSALLRNTIL